jgi:hypothetical protein
MRAKGFVKENAPRVSVELIIGELGIDKPIDFVIDTGSVKTVILDKDAATLRVDYKRLKESEFPFLGIGGSCEALQTKKNAALIFPCTTNEIYVERLNPIYFIRHVRALPEEQDQINTLPSVIGWDILSHNTLICEKGKNVYLEKK